MPVQVDCHLMEKIQSFPHILEKNFLPVFGRVYFLFHKKRFHMTTIFLDIITLLISCHSQFFYLSIMFAFFSVFTQSSRRLSQLSYSNCIERLEPFDAIAVGELSKNTKNIVSKFDGVLSRFLAMGSPIPSMFPRPL